MATEKQKKAIENVVENRGNVSKATREAGNFLISLKEHKNKNFNFTQILKQI